MCLGGTGYVAFQLVSKQSASVLCGCIPSYFLTVTKVWGIIIRWLWLKKINFPLSKFYVQLQWLQNPFQKKSLDANKKAFD